MSESNGTTSPAKSLREEIREKRQALKLIELELQLRQARRSLPMTCQQILGPLSEDRKSYAVQEATDQWDYLNTYQDLLDRLRQPDGVLLTPISVAYDRAYGANWPFWRTWTDHAKLRGISRMMVGMFQQAEGALHGLTSYVLGTGTQLLAVPKKGENPPKELVEAVQERLDQFCQRNNWNAASQLDPSEEFGDQVAGEPLERELFRRIHRDGEYFIRAFVDDNDGCTLIRTVEPEYVIEASRVGVGGPLGSGVDTKTYSSLWEYSFGVETPADDVQHPTGFIVSYTGGTGDCELIPRLGSDGQWMMHVKNGGVAGVDRSIKRGCPDFVFGTYDDLKTASRALDNMGEMIAIQSAIALVRQHDTAGPSQVAAFQQQLADYQRPDPFTGNNVNVQRLNAGTVYDVPKGLNFVVNPFGQSLQYWTPALEMILRNIAVKWNAPAWLLSGDASNNNYASSITAESPWVKFCKQRQKEHCWVTCIVAWRAVKGYADWEGGKLKAAGRSWTWDEIIRQVSIQVTPGTIEVRNKLEEAQENTTYIQGRVKSPQTVCGELGLDYEQEQQNFEDFDERTGGTGIDLPLPTDPRTTEKTAALKTGDTPPDSEQDPPPAT